MTTSAGLARATRASSAGRQAGHVVRRARAGPDERVAEERALHQDGATAGSGNGATAPGAKPVARSTSSAFAMRAFSAPTSARDLLRVASPVSGNQRDDRLAVADEDERLHDLVELAADGGGGLGGGRRPGGELLDAGLGAGVAKVRGNPLDGLRPGRYHGRESTSRGAREATSFR